MDLPVGPRRGANDDIEHAGGARRDDAHRDSARIRRAAARHVDRRRRDRDLAQLDVLALRERNARIAVDARVGDLRDVRDRHLQAGDELERERLDRLVELLRRDEQRARLAPAVSKRCV